MAAYDTTRAPFAAAGIAGRIGTTFLGAFGNVAAWNDARVTRNSLSKLSNRELDDIGLTRGQIEDVAEGRARF